MNEETTDKALWFPDLSIKGFRGIRDLSISPLGRVTLITGKNNTGKSSILEALRLHSSNASLSVVHEILELREENVLAEADGPDSNFPHPDNLFDFSSLFHGFPSLSEISEPIAISTSGKGFPMELTMQVGWFVAEDELDGEIKWVARENANVEESSDALPFCVVETEDGVQNRRRLTGLPYRYSRLRRGLGVGRMPCVFVNPHAGEDTYTLDDLWSRTALTDDEENVIESLRIIDPNISAVSMIGGSTERRRGVVRTAIVRSKNIHRPVPLRSFGDGVNRLFAIILSLVNAQGGLLLIDEFENGLHHSVQKDVWRAIFKISHKLDVQVFATTHSQDAVKAFQKAASESPGENSLVSLARRGDRIIPVVLSESDLAIANRHNMRVRG